MTMLPADGLMRDDARYDCPGINRGHMLSPSTRTKNRKCLKNVIGDRLIRIIPFGRFFNFVKYLGNAVNRAH